VAAIPYGEDQLSVRQILATLWRRKWLIGGVFFGTLLLAHLMIVNLTPRYSARSLLILNLPGQSASTEDGTGDPGSGRDAPIIATQIQILQSTALADQVVRALDLTHDPEFNPTLRPPSGIGPFLTRSWQNGSRWVIARLDPGRKLPALPKPAPVPPEIVAQITAAVMGQHLAIENDGKSFVVSVTCSSAHPDTAAKIVNTLIALYFKDQVSAKDQQAQGVSQWLDGKLVDLRQKQIEASKAVQQYREKSMINDVPAGGTSSPLSSLEIINLSQTMLAAQAASASAESEMQNATALGEDGGGSVSSTSSPVAQEVRDLRDQLHTLERRRAEYTTQYGPHHPLMLAVESDIASTRTALAEAQGRVSGALATQVLIDRNRQASLTASMKKLQDEYHRNSRSAVELSALQSEADAARNVLQTFMVEALKASARVETQVSDVRVLAPAETPHLPSFPNPTLLNGLAVIVGTMLALIGVIIMESLDKGLRDGDEVEMKFGLPVLGMLPQFRRRLLAAPHTRLLSPHTTLDFMESVRSAGTAICANAPYKKGRVVTITSVLPREGKTTFSAELARMLAEEGEEVLVIDCDWRRPSLAKHFTVDQALGMPDVAETGNLKDSIGRDVGSGVSVLAAGERAFNRNRFEAVIEKARREYDIILLDCPPLGVVNDPLLQARFSDAVVLLVQWGSTPQALVRATLRKFQAAKITPLGIVLSKVNFAWLARNRTAIDTHGHFTRYITGQS
jgi:succinoglycan biosynthesis transport protein ExoP